MSSAQDRPTLDERYELATNTSNLKHQAEGRTAADVLRDVAMSSGRLGAALRRLRAQWAAVEKPVRPRTKSVKEWGEMLPRVQSGTRKVRQPDGSEVEEPVMVVDQAAAQAAYLDERERHEAAYARELQRLASLLPDLPAVCAALTEQALRWGMGKPADPITRSERAEQRQANEGMLARHRKLVDEAADDAEKLTAQATLNHWIGVVRDIERQELAEDTARARTIASEIVRYWLDQTCPKCEGRKFQYVANMPTKLCPAKGGCGGTGVAQVPHGQDGRKLANHLDQCLHRHEKARKERKRDITELPPIAKTGPGGEHD